MSGPRTKLGTLDPVAPRREWVGSCIECQAFVEAWAFWCPRPRPSVGYVGRPKVVLDSQALHQVALFSARWLTHLRMIGEGMWRGDVVGGKRVEADMVDEHLGMNGMGEWLLTVQALRPYLRRTDGASWGELGVISAKRWRDDVQYQAVRRLLAHRLEMNQKSLRRRFDERAYWGELAGKD